MANIPWILVPLVVYNLIVFVMGSSVDATGAALSASQSAQSALNLKILSLPMISGASWSYTLGDLVLTLTLGALFIEILKATRTRAGALVDHSLSMLVFIVALVLFLLVGEAATSVFFFIMLVALIDVVAGFTVGIQSAKRDIDVGGGA